MTEQTQLDTRALEMASKAVTLVEIHMKNCEKKRIEDRCDRAGLRKDVKDGFAEVHTRINDDRKSSQKIMMAVIVGLVGIVGALFMRAIGWA